MVAAHGWDLEGPLGRGIKRYREGASELGVLDRCTLTGTSGGAMGGEGGGRKVDSQLKVERRVEGAASQPLPCSHVDRSRYPVPRVLIAFSTPPPRD